MSRSVHCTVCDTWLPLDQVLDHFELDHRDKMSVHADHFVVVDLDSEAPGHEEHG